MPNQTRRDEPTAGADLEDARWRFFGRSADVALGEELSDVEGVDARPEYAGFVATIDVG